MLLPFELSLYSGTEWHALLIIITFFGMWYLYTINLLFILLSVVSLFLYQLF